MNRYLRQSICGIVVLAAALLDRMQGTIALTLPLVCLYAYSVVRTRPQSLFLLFLVDVVLGLPLGVALLVFGSTRMILQRIQQRRWIVVCILLISLSCISWWLYPPEAPVVYTISLVTLCCIVAPILTQVRVRILDFT